VLGPFDMGEDSSKIPDNSSGYTPFRFARNCFRKIPRDPTQKLIGILFDESSDFCEELRVSLWCGVNELYNVNRDAAGCDFRHALRQILSGFQRFDCIQFHVTFEIKNNTAANSTLQSD